MGLWPYARARRGNRGPPAHKCSGQEPRTSPEYVPPGGNLTHTLGQTSVSEVNDQTSSNPTVSRGSLAPPRHPRRGRGSGLVNVSMNNGILGLIRAHPCMGGGPRPSPAGRGSTDDGLQRLILAHPYMGGGPRPSPAGRGSNLGGSIVERGLRGISFFFFLICIL